MVEAKKTVPFDEFASNVSAFFDRVVRDNETIVVERDKGEAVALQPVKALVRRKRKRTKADCNSLTSWA